MAVIMKSLVMLVVTLCSLRGPDILKEQAKLSYLPVSAGFVIGFIFSLRVGEMSPQNTTIMLSQNYTALLST
jgi:hypothetical protein